MTIKKIELPMPLLKLDLQYFNDDDDTFTDGDAELAATIRGLLESEEQGDNLDDEPEVVVDEDLGEDDPDDHDDDDDVDPNEYADDDDEYEEPEKKVQSKEDNARFAKERREREAQQRAEQQLEQMKQNSPEFQLAKMLSEQSGKSVEDIMEEIKEAQLKQKAKAEGVPVERLRKERESDERTNRLEEEITMLKFQNWQTTIKSDGDRLLKEYSVLTQEDIDQARDYILHTAKNVDVPLEDAVFAIHGKKMVEAMAKNKVQDELASQSGRKKKTPLAPNNGNPTKVVSLTAEEKYAARAFGMTDEEYIKYK